MRTPFSRQVAVPAASCGSCTPKRSRTRKGNKGNRNEIDGKTIAGVHDKFRLDGGERRRFQTLWFRTYRYVQLEIETGDARSASTICTASSSAIPSSSSRASIATSPGSRTCGRSTGAARGSAPGRRTSIPRIRAAPIRRRHTHPGAHYAVHERRRSLVRQAIEHFDLSRFLRASPPAATHPTSGSTFQPSRRFGSRRCTITGCTVTTPNMCAACFPGFAAVLGWFERRIDQTGMVGPISWWPFVDWAQGWDRSSAGRRGGALDGDLAAVRLRPGARGRSGGRARYPRRRRALPEPRPKGARRACGPVHGTRPVDCSATGRKRASYSQQANVMAVLTDAVAPADQAALMERVLSDATLTQSTYYFSYYQLEALRKAGLGDRYIDQLGPWRGMLELGLTTVPETPEPTRSDSHAWSAHPNYGLLATVLGVRPAEPGFRSVRIAPHLGPLQRAEGRVPHPKGEIVVRLCAGDAADFAARSPCLKDSGACSNGEGRNDRAATRAARTYRCEEQCTARPVRSDAVVFLPRARLLWLAPPPYSGRSGELLGASLSSSRLKPAAAECAARRQTASSRSKVSPTQAPSRALIASRPDHRCNPGPVYERPCSWALLRCSRTKIGRTSLRQPRTASS